jgi:HEAT repeat protein
MKTTVRVTVRIAIAMMAAILITPSAATATVAAEGTQRRWSIDFRVRLDQPQGEAPIQIRITGDWMTTVTAVRSGEYDAQLQLSNVRTTGEGIPHIPEGAAAKLQQRLERPFWATYRDDGELLSIHFYKDVDPGDRNLLQMIATETQLVHVDPSRPAWTVLERDGAGSYLAVYNWVAPDVVSKRKLKYIATDGVSGAPAGALQLAVHQSELRFSIDADRQIVTLQGIDKVRIGFEISPAAASGKNQLESATEIHLTNLRQSRAPELIGSLARARDEVVTSPIVTHNPDPQQLRSQTDDSLLQGHTTESLLQAAVSNSSDRMLPTRLAALFRRRPEAVRQASAMLRKDGPHRRITDALGKAGSPEAIEALGALARDHAATRSLRIDALTALVLVPSPTLEAMFIPTGVIDDADAEVRSTARFISGALARSSRTEFRAEAEDIDAQLIACYRKATDIGDLSTLIEALGNSVGPTAVPVIEEAMRDARPVLRAAAARSLRLAPGSEIDRVLATAISSDKDPRVRADAIFAASFRRPLASELGEALVHAAKSDDADYVRSAAVSLLRRNPNVSPGVTQTLAWVADNDAKPGIRRLAKEALASMQQ